MSFGTVTGLRDDPSFCHPNFVGFNCSGSVFLTFCHVATWKWARVMFLLVASVVGGRVCSLGDPPMLRVSLDDQTFW